MMLESRTDSVLRGLHTQTGGSTPRRRRLVGLLTAAEAISWRSVTYGNGTFVAVAGNGTSRVMTSPDGVTWTARTAAEANYWTSVTYGNGTFVAVSSDGTSRVMTSADGVTWTARTAAAANYWQSVTFGNGTFVAVASTGQVMSSADGVTWTSRTAAAASTWYSVTYGNGTFVAVAYSGRPTRVMTSADGVTWTAQTAAHLIPWVSVTYGNGTFVAVSSIGFVMTSADGVEWADQAVAEANSWYSVSYGNGTFVAVSVDGTNQVMTSPDGVTWTAQAAAEANSWYSVSYGNGTFVAVSLNGTSRVMTLVPASAPAAPTSLVATPGDGSVSVAFTAGSDGGASISNYKYSIDDGASWSAFSPSVTSSPVSITGLTNGTTYAVKLKAVNSEGDGAASDAVSVTPRTVPSAPTSLVGYRGYRSAEVSFAAGSNGGSAITNYKYSTDDGATWTALSPAVTSSPVTIGGLTNSTTYNIKLRAVNAAGDGAVSDAVSVTPGVVDAISWTARDAAEANLWVSVTYGNGLFVAVSTTGTHRVMTSPDGVSWTARDAAEANQWVSVTFGNGLFVAVAVDGSHRVMTSPDGVTWTARDAAEANGWRSVTFGNGVFVAVAVLGSHRVMTSPDGVTWTARDATEVNQWGAVTYGDGLFVAVAQDGSHRVMTSPDGVTWTARDAAEANTWRFVTYGNGLFVAVAGDGSHRVMTSPDGVTWTARDASEANNFYCVIYGNGLFVAVSTTGTHRVMTSSDGVSWTARDASEVNRWRSVVYANGLFVAVAVDGSHPVMTSSLAGVPAAPTSLVATPGNGSVSVSFTAGSDGGSPITNYEYELDGSGSWYSFSPAVTTPRVIIPVTNGVSYTVKLRAVNAVGSGAASVASASFTPRTVPSAPTGLVATRGDGQVSIAFTAGADGGTAITKYQYTIDDGGSWFDAEEGTSSPVTIGGLTNGTTYSIRLRAYSALRGTASAAVTVTPKTTLSAPTSLVATPGDGQVTIAFTAGANGGAAITKYQYRVGNGPWTDAVGTTSPITITGVANYTNPKVRIRAVNVSGPGAASAAVTARTRLAGPSLNSATAGVRSSVHVEYSELTIPDATINGYTATVYLKGTNTAVSTCHTNRNGRSCDIRKLSVGTEYDVRVVTYFKVTGDPIIRQTLDSNTVTVTTAN